MWEYDEYGNPYPAEERPDYDSSYYYNDESGSSQDYHGSLGGHQSSYGSQSDAHSHGHHHHHDHSHSGPHGHHHGHGGHDDDVESYYTDTSQQDYSSGHVTNERAYEPPAAPMVVPLPPQHGGHGSSGGYEVRVPTVTRSAAPASTGHRENAPDIFTSDSVVNLTLEEIDALATNRRSRAWLVVLYAPWCRFCQVAFKSVHFFYALFGCKHLHVTYLLQIARNVLQLEIHL